MLPHPLPATSHSLASLYPFHTPFHTCRRSREALKYASARQPAEMHTCVACIRTSITSAHLPPLPESILTYTPTPACSCYALVYGRRKRRIGIGSCRAASFTFNSSPCATLRTFTTSCIRTCIPTCLHPPAYCKALASGRNARRIKKNSYVCSRPLPHALSHLRAHLCVRLLRYGLWPTRAALRSTGARCRIITKNYN